MYLSRKLMICPPMMLREGLCLSVPLPAAAPAGPGSPAPSGLSRDAAFFSRQRPPRLLRPPRGPRQLRGFPLGDQPAAAGPLRAPRAALSRRERKTLTRGDGARRSSPRPLGWLPPPRSVLAPSSPGASGLGLPSPRGSLRPSVTQQLESAGPRGQAL